MTRAFKNIDYKEVVFQALFLVVLFFVYALDRHNPGIEWYEIAFFSYYTCISLVISYVLLPLFFYTKKYLKFSISLIIILGLVYIIEELVMEKLFFSGNRGKYISSVFFTLIEIIPILFMIVSFKLAWDANKKQQQIKQLQSYVKESELRFLKSQINPHFLFNNLNNLYSYAIEGSSKTPSIILELSSALRYMLYDCKEDFVSLTKEVEHLKHFTGLSELQIEDRGQVNFSTSNISEKFVIAPLILSMFVENAFKHSTASQSDNIFINIQIHVIDDGTLKFTCENSFSPKFNIENLSQGIGLQNVKKRLEILYPQKHNLEISDVNGVYRVNLTLKLQTKS